MSSQSRAYCGIIGTSQSQAYGGIIGTSRFNTLDDALLDPSDAPVAYGKFAIAIGKGSRANGETTICLGDVRKTEHHPSLRQCGTVNLSSKSPVFYHDQETGKVTELWVAIQQMQRELAQLRPLLKFADRIRSTAAVRIQRWWRHILWAPPRGRWYQRSEASFTARKSLSKEPPQRTDNHNCPPSGAKKITTPPDRATKKY